MKEKYNIFILFSFVLGFLLNFFFSKIETIKSISQQPVNEKITTSSIICKAALLASLDEYSNRLNKIGLTAEIQKSKLLPDVKVRHSDTETLININGSLFEGIINTNSDKALVVNFTVENRLEQTLHTLLINKVTGIAIHSSIGTVSSNERQYVSGYQYFLMCKNDV